MDDYYDELDELEGWATWGDDYDEYLDYDPDYDEYPDLYDVEVLTEFELIEVDGYMVAHQYVKEVWLMADNEYEVHFNHIPLAYTVQMPPMDHPCWKYIFGNNEIPF